MHELTKEQVVETSKSRIYDFFEMPIKRVEPYFYQLPIHRDDLFNKKDMEELKKCEFIKSTNLNSFIAIRKSGQMFTYGQDIVPIIFWTQYQSRTIKIGKNKTKEEKYFTFRFHAFSIDDYSMSFLKNIETYEEMIQIYKDVFDFLEIYTEMPDEKEFISYWKEKQNIIDFDFN